jgi:sulfonate transport system permease protein
LITLYRVFVGFVAGTAAATVLGSLTGYSKLIRELLDPTLQALRNVPSIAWVPLFIVWLGIYETSKITLIAVGVFFPVYLNLMSGIQNVDRKLVEVGRCTVSAASGWCSACAAGNLAVLSRGLRSAWASAGCSWLPPN